ncbi:MAG TPA: tRNA lysidine(34) synthetase TilS [Acidimicrobiales bacterium]|nr:tRNA lysidine(34) synthetase TilS [Acidimicrobiales bacterium]
MRSTSSRPRRAGPVAGRVPPYPLRYRSGAGPLTALRHPSGSPDTLALLSRCTFPAPDTAVHCAVSGGADSLALLLLASSAGCSVTAIHVDHGLRPGSEIEGDLVRDVAARYGAAFRAERVDLAPGPNLEARARAARFSVLPPGVLTGHTADDQAETVLLNLMRGAGLDGLSGMSPTGHPILRLRRRETVALCEAEGITPFEDPSNSDPAFRRNRVRAELLPLLDAIAERDVAALLARQAYLLRAEGGLLDELAAELDPTDARALARAPEPLARRALRTWLSAQSEHPPTASTIGRALAVARGDALATDLGGGRRLARTAGRLRVEPPLGDN